MVLDFCDTVNKSPLDIDDNNASNVYEDHLSKREKQVTKAILVPEEVQQQIAQN